MKSLGSIRNVSVRNLEFFGILVGFVWVNSNLGWNSNLNLFWGLRKIRKLHYCTQAATSLLAQLHIQPSSGPASRARAVHQPRRA
jgi:hypothetical protein